MRQHNATDVTPSRSDDERSYLAVRAQSGCATAATSTALVRNATATFTANLTSGNTFWFSINYGDGTMEVSSYNQTLNNNLTKYTYNYIVEGIYSVAMLVWTDTTINCTTVITAKINVENSVSGFNVSGPATPLAYDKTVFDAAVSTGSGVMYFVDFGDGQTCLVASTNWTSYAAPTAINQTYWNQSSFNIYGIATNTVGGTGGGFNVSTLPLIYNLTFYGNTSLLVPPGQGRWGVVLGLNLYPLQAISCNWTIGSNRMTTKYNLTQLNSTTPLEVAYTYKVSECGLQTVIVNCSNPISWQFYSINVTVTYDIVQLGLFQSGSTILWNSTSTLTLNITRVATGSCFEFNMGDGSQLIVYQTGSTCTGIVSPGPVGYVQLSGYAVGQSALVTVNYTYAMIGNYTVNVRGFNHVNNVTLTVSTAVMDWICLVPNVTLANNLLNYKSPLSATFSTGFTIVPIVNVACTKCQQVIRRWDVFVANPLGTNRQRLRRV